MQEVYFFAPPGRGDLCRLPTASAVGCILAPLRGWLCGVQAALERSRSVTDESQIQIAILLAGLGHVFNL
jgi:hypothetical protein